MDKTLIPIAIDWLQLNCHFLDPKKRWNEDVYSIVLQNYSTRHFRKVEYIYRRSTLIATAVSEPIQPQIKKESVFIKFENKYLYQKDLYEWIREFVALNKLQLINFTRLDVAIDFNSFIGGRLPENLIKAFVAQKIVKVGKSKFTTSGKVDKEITWEYMRFGKANSAISCYLYNKTKEMNEVKMKPYIKDNWIRCGLDVAQDVWRLEFSFKGAAKKLKDSETGEIISFKNLVLIKDENIFKLWCATIKQYFTFAIKEQQQNKSRWNRIKLFDNVLLSPILMDISIKSDGSRADKIFINKLLKTAEELRGIEDSVSEMCRDVAQYQIFDKGFEEFANRSLEIFKTKKEGVDYMKLTPKEQEEKVAQIAKQLIQLQIKYNEENSSTEN